MTPPLIAHPVSYYANRLRPGLPKEVFRPVPSRIAWLLLHLSVIAVGALAFHERWLPGWSWPLLALVIGHSFAGAAFVGHEALHGAVVRSRAGRYLIGWLSFLPFCVPPHLWVAWHNKIHHGYTGADGIDPDAFPTLASYEESALLRFADRLAVARGRIGAIVTLFFGFTLQATQMLVRWAPRSAAVSRQTSRLAWGELILAVATWALVGHWLGGVGFLFAFVLPLMVGNLIVISYILTNHSLSPLTEVNDPLLNSLTVTTSPVWQRLHLNFGLHVEHHLFPSMSSAYAPMVRERLIAHWPERYQSLPLLAALGRLFRTARIYRSPTELTDPRTGATWSTLLPRPGADARNVRAAG